MEITTQNTNDPDHQEVVVEELHSNNNILISSLDGISTHISRQVKECETYINDIQYCDKKSNILDKLDSEIKVSQPYHSELETWFPDNYESPCVSPSLSSISHISSFKDPSGFGESEEEGDEGDYDNYFNRGHEEQSSSNIYEMLNGIQDFKKQVLEGINKKYLKKSLLYLCRINVAHEETYKYTVGFTRDLENVLENIDETYTCEWKMEILTLSESKSQNEEIKTKYELLQQNVNIDNNLDDVNNRVYNHMTLNADYINPFYTVDDDGNETYLGKKVAITEHTSEHIE